MSETGWGIVFVLGMTAAVTVVLVVLIWQAFRTWQVKAVAGPGAADDEAYRRIAAQVAAVRRETAAPAPPIGTTVGGDDAEGSR